MTDREKVIKGLECCKPMMTQYGLGACDACPYDRASTPECGICDCLYRLLTDALALLRAQEPKVLTLEELPGHDGAFLVESRRKGDMVWASWYADYDLYGETVTRMVDIDCVVDDRVKRMYGSEWRCWTSRPTEEQREATPWTI